MSADSNKRLVLSYFENFSAGKFSDVLALMADGATVWIAGKPDKFALAGTKTKMQFADTLKGVAAAIPKGLRLTPKGIVADGERVAAEVEAYGVTATGKVYNNLYHFLFEIRDGKIQSVREYFDTMHAKEVLLDR
jgi:ketosteroid isomerase-like protein